MVSERFNDYMDDMSRIEFKGYRCLVCGEILDATIIEHRQTLEAALTR